MTEDQKKLLQHRHQLALDGRVRQHVDGRRHRPKSAGNNMTAREVERLLVRTAYPLTPIGKEDSVKLNQYEVGRRRRRVRLLSIRSVAKPLSRTEVEALGYEYWSRLSPPECADQFLERRHSETEPKD